jgi:protein-S-isoprenylcysteine O-methyltransferase Ste14
MAMLKLPPPIWMFIALALCGVASALYPWKALADLTWRWPGIALTIAAFAFALWWRMTFFFAKTEINPTSSSNRVLVTTGPFAFTRNPMYLGLVLFSVGIALWAGSLPMFLVPVFMFWLCNTIHIPFEEAKMQRQFPDAFAAYTVRVRRWI